MQRFFQFRLGALLLVVTVVSLCLAFWQSSIAPFQLQKEAIAELQKLGAEIHTRPANPYWMEKFVGKEDFVRVDSVTFASSPIKNEQLGQLREIKGLRRLAIYHCPISDDGLAQLRGVDSLEELALQGTNVTSDGIRHIAQIRTLKSLDLRYTNITNESLKHLARLVALEELFLPRSINEDALPFIARLPRLRRVDLSLTTVRPQMIPQLASCPLESPPVLNRPYRTPDIQYLVKLPSLKHLQLADTVHDLHAAEISKLRQLEGLSLNGPLAMKGLQSLADLPNLESLTLSNNAFDEPELAMLADQFRLRNLWLNSTALKAESALHLKRCRRLKSCFLYSPWLHPRQIDDLTDELSHIDEFNAGTPSTWQYNENNEVTSVFLQSVSINQDDLKHLARIPTLEFVSLHNCTFQASARVLQPLAALKHLKSLSLSGSNVQSQQLVTLTDLPSLETVELDSTAIDDAVARYLVQLPRLESLKLLNILFTDRGVQWLSNSRSLKTLSISSPTITADCLRSVREFESLKELIIGTVRDSNEKPVTAAALVRLKADMPDVKVHVPYLYAEYDPQNRLHKITGFDSRFDAYDELFRLQHLEEVHLQLYNYSKPARGVDQVTRVAEIAKIPNLKRFLFNEALVAPEAIDQLANMRNLESLELRNGAVQKGAIPHIARMHALKSLSFHVESVLVKRFVGDDFEPLNEEMAVELLKFSSVGVDEQVIQTIARWPKLQSMNLRNLGLNAKSFDHLVKTRNLKTLQLNNVTLTLSALNRFRQQRPDVEISQE